MFPIVQDQWLNIFLLNKFDFSFYPILYFISGLLFPILVVTNSLRNFNDYEFDNNKLKRKQIKYISYPIIFIVLILSLLIVNYFLFTLKYILPQVDSSIYFEIKLQVLLSLTVVILLLLNKTKRVLKNIFLINFFIISFVNWSIYFINLVGVDIYIFKNIYTLNLFNFKNINLINIIYLLIFDIFYYLCSYVTYKNNLSDWCIQYPTKKDYSPILKIIIFYLGILIYYIIFNRIS